MTGSRVEHRIPGFMAMMKLTGVLLLTVLMLGFVVYSASFGLRGLSMDLSEQTCIYMPGNSLANLAIFSHMALGAAVMAFALLQLIRQLRQRHPWLHRMTGRVIFCGAVIVSLGGLVCIGIRGTIAGALMDLGFALYGALMLAAAVQALRHARAGAVQQHSEWAR